MTTRTAANPVAPLQRPRRWLRRAAVVLPILAAVAYVAIPWYVPPEWLARRVAGIIREAVGRPVRIERISLSWTEGVRVDGLVIDELPEPGRPAQLLRIGSARCGLSPLKTLLTGKVDRLELNETRLWIALLPDGRLNIDDFNRRRQAGLPTYHYLLRDATLHLDMPDMPAQCRMDQADCRLETATGSLYLHGDATVRPRGRPADTDAPASSGRFWINGRMKVPRLKRGVALTGSGELRWQGVDLKDVPFRRLPRLGIDSVVGKTEGHVRLEVFPDLGVDFDLHIQMAGVAVQRTARPGPERIRDGLLAVSGHWDPAEDELTANKLDYRMPALRIHDTGLPERPAVILDRLAAEPMRLDLAGEVEDVESLRREFPEVDETLQRLGVQAHGAGRFTLLLSQAPNSTRGRLDANATAVGLICRDCVQLDAGIEKRLRIDLTRAADGRMLLHECRLDVADLHASAEASLPPLPPHGDVTQSWVLNAIHDAAVTLRFATPRVEQLAGCLPGLDRRLGDGPRQGPVEVTFSLEQQGGAPTFHARIASPAAADLRFADLLHKPSGTVLQAETSWICSVGPASETRPAPTGGSAGPDTAGALNSIRVVQLTADVAIGQGRVLIDKASAELDAGPDARTHVDDATARWRLPVTFAGIEHLLTHLPRLDRTLRSQEFVTRMGGASSFAGQARLDLEGTLTQRTDQTTCRITANADLGATHVRLGDRFAKSSGDPASVRLEHRFSRDVQCTEHDFLLRLSAPGLDADARYAVSGAPSGRADVGSADVENAHIMLAITDARRAMAHSAACGRLLAPLQLDGRGTAEITCGRQGASESLDLAVDAGGLAFVISGPQRFSKPAGVPCRIALGAKSNAANRAAWQLGQGSASLAGSRLRFDGGAATLSPAWTDWYSAVRPGNTAPLWRLRWNDTPATSVFQRIELAGTADIEADSASRGLSPTVDAWLARLGLVGRLSGRYRATLDPGSVRLSATLDTTQTHVSIELPDRTRFTKPIGMNAAVDMDIEQTRLPGPDGSRSQPSLVVHQAIFTAGNNRLDLRGQIAPAVDASPAPAEGGSLQISADLRRLDQVQALLPGHAWPPARGSITADAAIELRAGTWRLTQSNATLRDVALNADDIPLHAAGRFEFSNGELLCDGLRLRAGTSQANISGRAALSAAPHAAQVGLFAGHIDIDELRRLARTLTERLGPGPRTGADPWRWLCGATLDIHAQADRLLLTTPELGARADLLATSLAVSGRDGTIEIPVQISVDGGTVSGRIKFFLRDADPYFDLAYTAEDIAPGELAQAYLRRSFPGFSASGPLTLIDRSLQRIRPEPGQPNYPVGSGELIIDGGRVEGKAAPDWLVRIFPGLNLARYDFVRMHDWFTKHADGRADHRMIFQGRYYHLYMEGQTDADRNVRYEVGIDLLARLDSRYWVETQQGRIPLFVKTGRLKDDGTLDPDNVSFTPMRRVLETLAVQNNPAITAYYAIRKQVLNMRGSPAAAP